MTIDQLVESVRKYVEYVESTIEMEWGSCRSADELYKIGRFPEFYDKLPEAIKDLRKEWLLEEIVKLEGMRKKTNYPVNYSTSEGRKYTAMRDNHAGFNTCIDVLVGRYEAEFNKK